MAENGYWGTKTYRSGRIGEKVKFFVPYARGRKMGKSSPEKIASNANNVTRTVARYINDNFCHGDGWLSPTYDGERYERVIRRAREMMAKDPELSEQDAIWFAAQHEGELLMDRVRGLQDRGAGTGPSSPHRVQGVRGDRQGKVGDGGVRGSGETGVQGPALGYAGLYPAGRVHHGAGAAYPKRKEIYPLPQSYQA